MAWKSETLVIDGEELNDRDVVDVKNLDWK